MPLTRHAQAVVDLALALGGAETEECVAHLAGEHAAAICHAAMASVGPIHVDGRRVDMLFRGGRWLPSPHDPSPPGSMAPPVLLGGESRDGDAIAADARPGPAVDRRPGRRWRLSAPLLGRDGRSIGSLSLCDKFGDRPFTWADETLLVAVATLAAAALDRVREDARARALMRNVSDLVAMHDAAGTVRYASPSIESILGYRQEDAAGLTLAALVHPDDLPRLGSFTDATRGAAGGTPVVLRMRHRDGSWRLLEALASARAPDSESEKIVVTYRDLSELRRREREFEALAQHIPDVVARYDRDLRYCYINPAIEAATGMIPSEMIGRTSAELGVPEALCRPWERIIRRVFESGMPQAIYFETELGGEQRAYHSHIVPERDADGVVYAVLSVTRDLTAERRAVAALLESEARARAQFKNSPIPTFTWQRRDDDFVLIGYNDAAFAITEGAIDRLLGTTMTEMYADAPDVRADFEHCFRERRVVRRERHYAYRMVDKQRHLAVHYAFVPPDLVMVHTEDITERVRGEAALRFMNEASAALSSSLDFRATLATVARLAVPFFADFCVVYIPDEDGVLRRVAVASSDDERAAKQAEIGRRYPAPRDAASGAGHVIQTGTPELYETSLDPWIDAIAQDEGHRALVGALGLQSMIIVPMVARGKTLGAIHFSHAESGRHYSAADLALAADLARRAGLAVDNARLYSTAQRELAERAVTEAALRVSEQRFRDLFENANDIIYVHDLRGRFIDVNTAAEHVLGYTRAEIVGRNVAELVQSEHVERVRGLIARRLADEGDATHELEVIGRGGQRVVLEVSMRLIHEGGRPVAVQGIARDVTERRRLEAELSYRAFHDSLTGPPNRGLFLDRLGQALNRRRRADELVGVLFLDLDGFKLVNDSLGHPTGDLLLGQVCARLRGWLATADTVARFGGDEFAVLLEGLGDPADAARVAERLLAALRTPFEVDGREVFITASVGVAVARPHSAGADPEGLLRQVDVALYEAKAAGKNRFAVFDPMMQAAAIRRLDLETGLRRALERDQLRLSYQPEIDLDSGRIVGVEALLRWQHPTFGVIAPEEFIPVAEETGMIIEIGEWMLTQACRQFRVWRDQHPDGELVLSVNLSARELARRDLVESVAAVLERTGVRPAEVRIEVTETAAVADIEGAAAKLSAFKALGVQLALDDFGTGHSSLSLVRRFPVDVLKVDRSFVRELTYDASAVAIVESVGTLARRLGITVTAEGIETVDQIAIVRALAIHRAQGHLFAPALPAEAMGELLRTGLPAAARADLAVARPPLPSLTEV